MGRGKPSTHMLDLELTGHRGAVDMTARSEILERSQATRIDAPTNARPRLGHRRPEGVEVQMNRLLPTPTPQEIEAALTATLNDMSAFCLWLDGYLEQGDLWWVTIIFPDGERHTAAGGGNSSAEAAAVAWINCVFLLWSRPLAKVPRHVPEGFQFELHAAPVKYH